MIISVKELYSRTIEIENGQWCIWRLNAEASVWLSVNHGGVPSKCAVSTVSISNINQIIEF